eukprot:scaffold34271_cov73-Phaeocystis_antarctica.AAC.1
MERRTLARPICVAGSAGASSVARVSAVLAASSRPFPCRSLPRQRQASPLAGSRATAAQALAASR